MIRFALAIVCACAPSAPPATPATPPPAAASASDMVSPPFGAADLQRAMNVGTEIRYRITMAGQEPVIEHWRVTAADDTGCTIHTIVYAADGTTQIEDKGSGTAAWTELEKHGQFPRALTTSRDSEIVVGAGKFQTWLYEVAPANAGEPTKRLHFAREVPGPPVWMEVVKDGQPVMTLELLSRRAGL